MFSHQTSVLPGPRDQVIDLNAPPYEPQGLRAVQHLRYGESGRFTWHPPAVNLYRHDEQLTHRGLSAFILRERLLDKRGVRVFNANLLDFFARNPAIIPAEKAADEYPEIVFFGTIYSDLDGEFSVRTIRLIDALWVQGALRLSESCGRRYYAALWNENWLDNVSLN